MKKYYLFSMLAIAAMAAFSCTKEIELTPIDNEAKETTPVVKEPLVINAYSDDDIAPDTKTTLDGVNVRWASTDAIAGYKSDDVNPHTSTLTTVAEGGKKATFTFSDLTIGDDVKKVQVQMPESTILLFRLSRRQLQTDLPMEQILPWLMVTLMLTPFSLRILVH